MTDNTTPPAKPAPRITWTWNRRRSSSSSMCKEGTYAEGVTRAEVEAEVRGTFGGRFDSFGNGKFVYIAYTD